ncbi:MAG: hypothetical protein HQK53_17105 [Oligoflexia bacterium]|nr:hypothetical protein [Oligoflexia bacterium]
MKSKILLMVIYFGLFNLLTVFTNIALRTDANANANANANEKALKVGIEIWPPYQFWSNGKLVGMDIEILEFVLGAAGLNANYQEQPWQRQLKWEH